MNAQPDSKWAKTWVDRARSVLEPLLDCEVSGEWIREPEPTSGAVIWGQRSNELETAEIYVWASQASLQSIAERIAMAVGLDPSEELNQTNFVEAVEQITSALVQDIALSSQVKLSLQAGSRQRELADFSPLASFEVTFAGKTARLNFGANRVFFENYLAPEQPTNAVVADAGASTGKPRTMDLLLDVELPVTVSFGRAVLPLRDLVKLSSGSIVELNRSVTDPIEVIVNNCVIARGEVVVVNGNYGVRLQQIISRADRLRTLQ